MLMFIPSPRDTSEGLWEKLSPSELPPKSSRRLIGNRCGGGPKCSFCCWSFIWSNKINHLRICSKHFRQSHWWVFIIRLFSVLCVICLTCRARILPWMFSWDRILSGSGSEWLCSAWKMLSCEDARDPSIPLEQLWRKDVKRGMLSLAKKVNFFFKSICYENNI